ncbi:MAG: hypothetical protein ABFC28_08915 [Rikenellaceae bacterium]
MTHLDEKEKDFLRKFKGFKEKGDFLKQEESGLSELDFSIVALRLDKNTGLIKAMGETVQEIYTVAKLTILGKDFLQNHPDL